MIVVEKKRPKSKERIKKRKQQIEVRKIIVAKMIKQQSQGGTASRKNRG